MILKCEDVSIRYITGDFKDIGLKEWTMRHLTHNYQVTEFWADRHVTFEIDKGDMLGIIGSNGAGKSTLLKAVSGIMEPTEGYIQADGRGAAILSRTADVLEGADSHVGRYRWDGRLDHNELNRRIRDAAEDDSGMRFTLFDADSVVPVGMPADGGGNHRGVWVLCYQLEALREWLFGQKKNPPTRSLKEKPLEITDTHK